MPSVRVLPDLVLVSCTINNFLVGDLAGELVSPNRCFAQAAFGSPVALCPACNWLLCEYERIANRAKAESLTALGFHLRRTEPHG
jgi:hypothetical protein